MATAPGADLAEEYACMEETAKPWASLRKAAKVFRGQDEPPDAAEVPSEKETLESQLGASTPSELQEVQQDGLQEVETAFENVEEGPESGVNDSGGDDGSSDSSSSSSSSSVNEEKLHKKMVGDGYVKHTSEESFQHRKTKVLHRPGKVKGLLLCGRRCNDNYLHLGDGASFHWPRCSGCFRGEVLTSADQLVEAFDKVRAKRAQT